MKMTRWWSSVRTGVAVVTIAAILSGLLPATARAENRVGDGDDRHRSDQPVKHVVVIFQENVSFNHYFATYPHAENLAGEPVFTARPHTPKVDNLLTAGLLAPNNPNAVQPFRLRRDQAATCDQDHEYKAEQEAFNDGQMNRFVETVGVGGAS